MDIVVRDLDSGEETVVFDDGGYVVQTTVSHDESSVAVTALSLQPNGTVISLAGPLAIGLGALTSPDERANHHVAGWAPGDDGLVVASDHDRDFHAVWHVDLDGSLAAAGRARRARPGGPAVPRRHLDARQPPRRRPRHPGDPRGRRHPPRRRRPRSPSSRCRCAGRADGSRFVITAMTPTDPGSILSVDARTGAVTQLVDGRAAVPAELRDRLVTPTVHRVPTPDGEQVPCFRFAAPGADDALGGRLGRARPRRARVRGDPDVLGGVAVAGDGRLRRAGAQRARLGGVREALGLARRPRAAPGLRRRPGGDPRVAAVGRARRRRARRCGAAPTAATWCSPASRCSRSAGRPGSTSSASRRW